MPNIFMMTPEDFKTADPQWIYNEMKKLDSIVPEQYKKKLREVSYIEASKFAPTEYENSPVGVSLSHYILDELESKRVRSFGFIDKLKENGNLFPTVFQTLALSRNRTSILQFLHNPVIDPELFKEMFLSHQSDIEFIHFELGDSGYGVYVVDYQAIPHDQDLSSGAGFYFIVGVYLENINNIKFYKVVGTRDSWNGTEFYKASELADIEIKFKMEFK